ncbi:MAG: choice-of-anchor A family protein [Ignavibacteriales bacterium]
MKKLFYLFLFFFMVHASPAASAISTATILQPDKGVKVYLTSPDKDPVYAGTHLGTISANYASFYCIDLKHSIQYNAQYQEGGETSSFVTYILNNYYPHRKLPYSNSLGEIYEAAAVQLAIWSFTDQLNVPACTPDVYPAEIKNRAIAIILDAKKNAGNIHPFKTLVINIPSQPCVKGSVVQFYVEAYTDAGTPLAGVSITLSVNEGTLSKYTVTTNEAGVAGPIQLTAGPNNSTTIYATGMVTIPGGIQYCYISNPDGKQKFVIATPILASKTVSATVNWHSIVYLSISKTASVTSAKDGDIVTYEITIKNTGAVKATGVQVLDLLPAVLKFVSCDGSYNPSTGIWDAGSLNPNESKKLKITARVSYSDPNSKLFDLGIASDYNLFVLNDINQPSSDTQGRMAVCRDATLAGYSVGDQLPPHPGYVLVVGRKLTYKSGRVYGDISYGSYIDTMQWHIADGKICNCHPVDFTAAALYLNNLSIQLSLLSANGTVKFEYGMLELTGTNPVLNKFNIKGSDLSKCNTVTVNVPANSVVLINVSGDNIEWKGGFTLTGCRSEHVLINFYEATKIRLYGIEVKGSILAPKATLDFPSGVVVGQVIVYNMYGSGQFNHCPFRGRIPVDLIFSNIAEIIKVDQPMDVSFVRSVAQVAAEGEVTDVEKDGSRIPAKTDLLQNYPNPFNPVTKIRFDINGAGFYTLKVYNSLGSELGTIASGNYAPGSYEAAFDAGRLSSGVYIYQLQGPGIRLVRKMLFIK